VDLDYGKEVTEKNKQNILQQYALFAQKQRMEQDRNKLNILN
jgi:flagellin-like hook-associated protein FlgL